jgi:2-desacetyl-2-hydroxyethyl bacteriochlorophyllide A dehydrogenase
MKAVVLDAVNAIESREVPIDEVVPGEVLVRIEAAGICGSDRHILHGTYPANYPVILGHEFSGIIESAPTASKFKAGMRVNINPNIACGNCKYCKMGIVNLCVNNWAHGVNRNGGLANFTAVPESQLFELPLSLDLKFGALCEPLACCIQGIELAEIQRGDSVAIIGGGIIGQFMVQLAKLAGAKVVLLSTRQKFRRDLAESIGATHTLDPSNLNSNEKFSGASGVAPGGFDVVIECAGTKETLQQSLEIVRSGGTVILFGVMPQDEKFEISPFDLFVRQVRIQGVFTGSKVHGQAAKMIAEGKLNLEPLITHLIGLDEVPRLLGGQPLPGEVKTLVLPNH